MVDLKLQSTRQRVKRHEEYPGVLGNGFGRAYADKSRYWVRFPLGTNDNGFTNYSPARAIRYTGEAALFGREGCEVLVRIDPYDGVETISRMVPDYADRGGYDARLLNPTDAINQWWDAKNFIRLYTAPVGTNFGKITVRENPWHVDDAGEASTFAGTLPDDQLDLQADIPGDDLHALFIIYFDLNLNVPVYFFSTPQALTDAFDSTDFEEVYAQLLHNDYIWLKSFDLGNSQGNISQSDAIEDLRTWLPTPRIYGFPNPLTANRAIKIHDTHSEVVHDQTIDGFLTIAGDFHANSITLSATGSIVLEATGSVTLEAPPLPAQKVSVSIDDTDSPYTPGSEKKIFVDTSGGNVTISLPNAANALDFEYTIKNKETGTTTIQPFGVQLIEDASSLIVNSQYDAPKITSDGLAWWII